MFLNNCLARAETNSSEARWQKENKHSVFCKLNHQDTEYKTGTIKLILSTNILLTRKLHHRCTVHRGLLFLDSVANISHNQDRQTNSWQNIGSIIHTHRLVKNAQHYADEWHLLPTSTAESYGSLVFNALSAQLAYRVKNEKKFQLMKTAARQKYNTCSTHNLHLVFNIWQDLTDVFSANHWATVLMKNKFRQLLLKVHF